ncbi:serine/threonine protein kinase/beta-lactam-binding protein with PASTA domain [Arthrobacter sp. V4I6]|uniref:Stk1 family PASTA domain-containing Ser/Thr kinase n=1 Tax=unclassified Arthrobacter TaxID=235627 RepID=UPI00278A7D21|nr:MULTISPECIES: PASTA domain-containing protein [unclassified Arthrobacter]MDQ0821781.1 serine/threonine protein kinase/beta-lactam-binding protein with PASTA domain [Arthrobacter sp. V1I7]MDQ0856045.1 serine/threonine protein kinase/beta-lactam-binding protein with PASTA domain [Arthrobacter sp. V4I6]
MQEYTSDPLVGTLVDGRYLIQSRLASGGMSTVYLATDGRLERDVALKVLHPHLAGDPQFLDRLGREAKAAARLSHPHVVGVLDQGEDGRIAYLVMEYIKGHTLRDVLKQRGALPPRLALALVAPVVEGLGAAHAAGLIHRDIKPENVLIADDGRIKVGDFGLARAISTSTSTGALIGTVAYLSPELVLGKQADARSDIYSVGIMLYEMITGRQPFDGDVPIQVAYQHVNSTVGAPSALVPGLAEEIDELVQWCTANDPDKRPVDGNTLLSELRHIRTNLSDAELDIQPPAAHASVPPVPPPTGPPTLGRPAGRPDGKAAPDGPADEGDPHSRTEVIGGIQRPTEIISRGSNPTTVMSAAPRRPAYGPLSAPDEAPDPYGEGSYDDDGRGTVAGPASKRTQRKLDRDEEKARQRAAATPVRSLRAGNPRRRGLLWILLLVIAALLAAGAGWFFGMGPGSPGTIPQLANKTVAEAQQLLRTAGFQSTIEDVYDDNVPPGLVVGSEPDAGQVIRKFHTVSLAVSKGPELFPLPELTGKTLDEAKTTLNGAGMALGQITETFDESAAAGTVLSQAPRSGNPVKHGTPVALTVSKGPQPIPVPDVRGQEQDDAVKALEAAGLKAVIAPGTVNDRRVPKGAVLAQDPASGNLTKGGAVTLTISEGPRFVEVPSFIGKQAKEAEQALRQLGFEVRINNILGGFFGTVRDQDPVEKTVPEGSVVTLTVV